MVHVVDLVGGDPRTDHASLQCESQTSVGMGRYLSSLSARGRWRRKQPILILLLCLLITACHNLSFPKIQMNSRLKTVPTVPDELPSTEDTDMNISTDCETTLFPGIFRIAEKSRNSATLILEFKSCPLVSAHPS